MDLFSERYKDLIGYRKSVSGDIFCGNITGGTRVDIVEIMDQFSQPVQLFRNRYDHEDYEMSTALEVAFRKFFRAVDPAGMEVSRYEYDIFGFLISTSEPCLFDVIELQYEELSEDEKSKFQSALNNVLNSDKVPWVLHDGRMIKIDGSQFEQDLARRTLEEMEALTDSAPVFQAAFNELLNAISFLSKGDFAEAIMNAGKSYESILKFVCGEDTDTADNLVTKLLDSGLLKLPESLKGGRFRETVLMSLPNIRNSCAAHGSGTKDNTIDHSLASLAVNLACALDTYLIEIYKGNT